MILVVDDYPDSAQVLFLLLRKHGYPAQVVNSGPEALAAIRAHPREQPLLVILDDMMPEMTGMETLRAIRADASIASTPVMFYTAGFDIAKRDEAMALGARAWLFKGRDMPTLVQEVSHLYEAVGGAKTIGPDHVSLTP